MTKAKKVNQKLLDNLVRAKIQMLMKFPFYGTIAMNMPFIEMSDVIETAATDGRNILYNEEFMGSKTPEELVFIVAHEVLHCVYQHILRTKDRHPMLFNIAADYVINAELKDSNTGSMPEMCLFDDKYKGMFTEEIYELLKDEMKKKGQDPDDMKGKPMPGMPGQETTDCHVTFDPQTGEATVTTASGKEIKTDKIKPISGEERDKLETDLKKGLIRASQCAGDNISSGLKRLIEELIEPKVDWRSYLCAQVSYQVQDDFTFSRPSRKSRGTNYVLPGLSHGEHVELSVALDTSGSISHEMIREFLSEIEGICQQYRSYKMQVFCFDTAIHAVEEYSNERPFDFEEYEPAGGGGTDFEVIFAHLLQQPTEVKQLVVLTDGYPNGSWGDPNLCPTLFLINGDTSGRIKAPFGTTLHYDYEG